MKRREGSILPSFFFYGSLNISEIPFRRFHSLCIASVTVPVHEGTKVTICTLAEFRKLIKDFQ